MTSVTKAAIPNCKKKAVLKKLNNLSFVLSIGGKKAERDVPIPMSARSDIRRRNESNAEKYPTSDRDMLRTYVTVKTKAKKAESPLPKKTK